MSDRAVDPAELARTLDVVKQNLSALNEIVAELAVCAISAEAGWIAVVVKTLRDLSWSLGFEFQGERPDAEWLEAHDG